MSRTMWTTTVGLVAIAAALLTDGSALNAQAPASGRPLYPATRTPWGDPDLQGIYTNSNESGIPMARPAEFAGRRPEDVTPEEMARLAKQRAAASRRRRRRLAAPRTTTPAPARRTGTRTTTRRTAALDGTGRPGLPVAADYRRGEGARRGAARRPGGGDGYYVGPFRGPEEFTPYVRCITRGVPDR